MIGEILATVVALVIGAIGVVFIAAPFASSVPLRRTIGPSIILWVVGTVILVIGYLVWIYR